MDAKIAADLLEQDISSLKAEQKGQLGLFLLSRLALARVSLKTATQCSPLHGGGTSLAPCTNNNPKTLTNLHNLQKSDLFASVSHINEIQKVDQINYQVFQRPSLLFPNMCAPITRWIHEKKKFHGFGKHSILHVSLFSLLSTLNFTHSRRLFLLKVHCSSQFLTS